MAVKNSVLRPVKAGSKTIQIKIPGELFDRIQAVREKAKELGLLIDLDDPAVRAIRQVIEQAEEELKGIGPAPKSEPTQVTKSEDKPEVKPTAVKPLPVPAKVQEVSNASSQVRG